MSCVVLANWVIDWFVNLVTAFTIIVVCVQDFEVAVFMYVWDLDFLRVIEGDHAGAVVLVGL